VLGGWDPEAELRAPERAPDFIVDDPGGLQAAVDAAAARGGERRSVIALAPGTYRGPIYVPAASSPIAFVGLGRDPGDVRIRATLDASMAGTAGSAVVTVRNAGFRARNLTFENGFHKDTGNREGRSQAVALLVDDADRVAFSNVRFVGYQDTLYLRASVPARPPRVFVRDSYVEGDVDFIFGEATAYFLRTEVRSLGDHGESYALAPSTERSVPYGFVFQDCRFTHDGAANALRGGFKLARQWFRGRDPDAVGKAVILDSTIGAHIDKARPWADWGIGTPNHRPVQYDYLGEYRSLED
jgi:pectin methylesterase-like acyl-CoA thioesterase